MALEEVIQQAVAGTSPAGSPPAETAPAQGTPPASPSDASAVGGVPVGQAAQPAGTPAQQQQQWTSILEAARSMGYSNIPQGMNDHQFFQHLLLQAQQAEQNQRLAQYGQEFLQNRDAFSQWRQQQAAAEQQRQQGQKQNWWQAPEFDPAWRHQIYRDPTTGEVKALPNTPPEVIQKYQAYQAWERQSLDKLMKDPVGTLKPGIEELVHGIVQQAIQQQGTRFQDVQFTQQFLEQHKGWMYANDPISGQQRLSEWGQRFKGHVDSLVNQGVRGDQQIAAIAYAMTDREYLLSKMQTQNAQQTAQQTGDLQKQQFLAQAGQANGVPPNTTGNLPANGQQGQQAGMSLERRLQQAFNANGVTDQAIRASLGNVA